MAVRPQYARVYYRERLAGVLSKTDTGYEFVYDAQYLAEPGAQPISLSMPLRADKYESTKLFPFFDGLLPEGWLLDLISVAEKIDKRDKFRLLLHTGRDPIGAVSIHALDDETS
jgi:serine/threonine-protein kinase HipA